MDEENVERPAFLDKERAESIGYISGDEIPVFDQELAPLPPLEGDNPARGKGPSRGYEIRWREIARLHALGYTNNQIAKHLGYSPQGISLAMKQPLVVEEIERYRTLYFSQDALNIIKEAALDGARHIRNIILDPKAKESTRVAASQWAVEKATGKARQEISVESESLSRFMELAERAVERGQVVDVTPLPITAESKNQPATGENPASNANWDTWIAENVR